MKPSIIEAIVQGHLSSVKNEEVKVAGAALLRQWQESTPGSDFCGTHVLPAIEGLSKKARKKGFGVLRRVKDDIAGAAANESRRMELQRRSAEIMKQEFLKGTEVIELQGRGVAYFGSARSRPGDPDYEAARELGREVAILSGVTSWSGAGPGAMEAPIIGAKEAGGAVGGIKIILNDKESAFEQEVSGVFKSEEVAQMDFFGPRKMCLVDSSMAETSDMRRAVITFPGGFGTLDEFFELVTLKQLRKLGTQGKLPILLMNYGGYYDELLVFFRRKMLAQKKISEKDLTDIFTVCATNKEALDYLAGEFAIPAEERTYDQRLQPWSSFYPQDESGRPELTLHA